tara:strand:+ start:473 stop:670 length:198 start_codon:yes stop_codon:yes gene_type:complete
MPKKQVKNPNGNFTQKELLLMIWDRLDLLDQKIEEILEDKVSRKEMYSVIGMLLTFALVIGSFLM